MNRLLIAMIATTAIGPGTALADPTFLLGGGISFGGGNSPQFTVSGKVLSDNQQDEPVAGLGLNYYLGTGDFGADLGLGYLFEDSAVMLGYDFLGKAPLITFGWADTESDIDPAPAD